MGRAVSVAAVVLVIAAAAASAHDCGPPNVDGAVQHGGGVQHAGVSSGVSGGDRQSGRGSRQGAGTRRGGDIDSAGAECAASNGEGGGGAAGADRGAPCGGDIAAGNASRRPGVAWDGRPGASVRARVATAELQLALVPSA